MTIYFDELLCVNFILNTLILLFTAWAAGHSAKFTRIGLSAFCGAAYALGEALPGISFLYLPAIKILASCFLVFIAFGYQTWQCACRLFIIFWSTSFLFGGAVLGWYFFFQTPLPFGRKAEVVISIYHLIGGGVVGAGLILVWSKCFLHHFDHHRLYFPVKVTYRGTSIELQGFLDTGNHLYSFIEHKPVILIDSDALAGLFKQSLLKWFETKSEDLFSHMPPEAEELAERLEVISYHGIGAENLMTGFRPDWIELNGMKYQVVIGITSNRLSHDDSYQVLLHPALIAGTNFKKEADICA